MTSVPRPLLGGLLGGRALCMVTIMRTPVTPGQFVETVLESLAGKNIRNLENLCPCKPNTPIVAPTLSQDWQDSKGMAQGEGQ